MSTEFDNPQMHPMELTTEELSAFFASDSKGFSDDEKNGEHDKARESTKSIDDLALTNEFGQTFDFADVVDDYSDDEPADEADDISDLRNAEAIDEDALYSLAGETYEYSQLEKAVTAYKDINTFFEGTRQLQQGLEEAEEHFNKLQAMAYGQIDAALEYWQGIADAPNTNDTDYRMAIREIRNAEAKKREIEQGYSQSREIMNQRKREAEALKAQAVRNELVHTHGWNQSDMQTVADYIINNGMVINSANVDSKLMLALRKAALFDANKNAVKVDAESKVIKALGHKTPAAKTRPEQVADDGQAKRKAKALAAKGELSTSDMFAFLDD